MEKIHNELKKEFQLERMILFSDAVFAIAITLLVIEIRVPVLDGDISDKEILRALLPLSFKFNGFIISFFIVALYWTVHHRMFGYVEHYNETLLWLNLFFLFSIILMPFSSGIYGEYAHKIQLIIPYGIYVINICLTGFTNYFLWKYIGNPKHKVAAPALDSTTLHLAIRRSLIVPAVFFASFLLTLLAPLSLWFPVSARFFPLFIPILMKRSRTRYKKRHGIQSKKVLT